MAGGGGDGLDTNKELYQLGASQEETKLELADLRRQVVYLQVFARRPDFLAKYDLILSWMPNRRASININLTRHLTNMHLDYR